MIRSDNVCLMGQYRIELIIELLNDEKVVPRRLFRILLLHHPLLLQESIESLTRRYLRSCRRFGMAVEICELVVTQSDLSRQCILQMAETESPYALHDLRQVWCE